MKKLFIVVCCLLIFYYAVISAPPGSANENIDAFLVAANDANLITKARASYVCDGIADNIEIQKVLADLPSAGGRVVLSEGTFNITSTLTISEGVTLEGMGEQATSIELSYDPNFDGLSLTGGTQWTYIKNLSLIANAPITPTYAVDGISINGSMTQIENVFVKYASRNGIYARNFVHLRIINTYVRYSRTGSGLYLRRASIQNDSANQIYIEGGNYIGNENFGIWFYQVSNAIVDITNLSDNDIAGIGITGGTNITINNSWFENNANGLYVRNGALAIGRTTGSNELAIKNCTFNNSGVWDIDVFSAQGIRIEDCVGNIIRLASDVSEIIYDHSIFDTEVINGSYWEN